MLSLSNTKEICCLLLCCNNHRTPIHRNFIGAILMHYGPAVTGWRYCIFTHIRTWNKGHLRSKKIFREHDICKKYLFDDCLTQLKINIGADNGLALINHFQFPCILNEGGHTEIRVYKSYIGTFSWHLSTGIRTWISNHFCYFRSDVITDICHILSKCQQQK